MEELKKNKLVCVILVVTVFNLSGFFVGTLIINKITDRVIQKLKKEYSPSPYHPGFDPDKVDISPLKEEKASEVSFHQSKIREANEKIYKTMLESEDLRNSWEAERVNP